MHDTANLIGLSFAEKYGGEGKIVVDIGGCDVNGSLRKHFEERGMQFICVDIEPHPSVDIVVKPGENLPFKNNSVDLIVSTSCFEHDPCFWITFKNMTRILKMGGYIYINAPTNGPYHCHPGDNWRFYSDAGQALAYWASYKMHHNEEIFPVKLIETFHVLPLSVVWIDFVCVWQRVEERETTITVSPEISHNVGILQQRLHERGLRTVRTPTTII